MCRCLVYYVGNKHIYFEPSDEQILSGIAKIIARDNKPPSKEAEEYAFNRLYDFFCDMEFNKVDELYELYKDDLHDFYEDEAKEAYGL